MANVAFLYDLASDVYFRLQAQGTPGAAWACARDTLKKEGLIGFYAGLTPTLIKVCFQS